jgi:hypothetical protein
MAKTTYNNHTMGELLSGLDRAKPEVIVNLLDVLASRDELKKKYLSGPKFTTYLGDGFIIQLKVFRLSHETQPGIYNSTIIGCDVYLLNYNKMMYESKHFSFGSYNCDYRVVGTFNRDELKNIRTLIKEKGKISGK